MGNRPWLLGLGAMWCLVSGAGAGPTPPMQPDIPPQFTVPTGDFDYTRREVMIDHATREAHVTYVLQTGPTATMGPVHFSGSGKVNLTYLQKRVPYKEGSPYKIDKVNELRDKLTGLGVFSAVRITP